VDEAEAREFVRRHAEVDGCWTWRGRRERRLHGESMTERQERQPVMSWAWDGQPVRLRHARDVAYEAFVGPIPEGQRVVNDCGNRACVNPDHLALWTGLA
jgi:hypothetical protein